jgi:hypothetical protein
MTTALALQSRLLAVDLYENTENSLDELLRKALHLFTEKHLEKALAIVDDAGVTCVMAEASRRHFFQACLCTPA